MTGCSPLTDVNLVRLVYCATPFESRVAVFGRNETILRQLFFQGWPFSFEPQSERWISGQSSEIRLPAGIQPRAPLSQLSYMVFFSWPFSRGKYRGQSREQVESRGRLGGQILAVHLKLPHYAKYTFSWITNANMGPRCVFNSPQIKKKEIHLLLFSLAPFF